MLASEIGVKYIETAPEKCNFYLDFPLIIQVNSSGPTGFCNSIKSKFLEPFLTIEMKKLQCLRNNCREYNIKCGKSSKFSPSKEILHYLLIKITLHFHNFELMHMSTVCFQECSQYFL